MHAGVLSVNIAETTLRQEAAVTDAVPQITNLTHIYSGGVRALDDVSLSVPPGTYGLLERDQEKHVPAKVGMESGFPSDRATNQ